MICRAVSLWLSESKAEFTSSSSITLRGRPVLVAVLVRAFWLGFAFRYALELRRLAALQLPDLLSRASLFPGGVILEIRFSHVHRTHLERSSQHVMNEGESRIAGILQQLIDRTRAGEIRWTQGAPSIFSFVKNSREGEIITSIQCVPGPSSSAAAMVISPETIRDHYVLNVSKKENPEPKLLVNIQSSEKRDLQKHLHNLYNLIVAAEDIRTAILLEQIYG
jgi:hypothetical protein